MEIQDAFVADDIIAEKADKSWKEYCELIKIEPRKQYKILKDAYYQLKQGRTIIDVYKAFEVAGTFDDGTPKLAIGKANTEKVVFEGANWGQKAGGFFSNSRAINPIIRIPCLTQRNIRAAETLVPIVPAEHHPQKNLSRYYILWEVEEGGWNPIPNPPNDPLLLTRISKNLFAVMAAWDLTDLEKAALKSALL